MQQESAHRLRLVRQHLLDEVVDDVPVVPGEPGDEAADVVAPPERECGELQRGDPPLGAFLQGLDVPRGEAQSRRFVEVGGGLVGGEPQVGGTDLDQLAASPPSREWQVGVGAGAEHDVDVGREVLQQEGQPLVDLVVVDQVVVVEDQPHLARCCGQLVEQSGEHKVGRQWGGGDELQRTRANAGHGALEGAHDVRPERRRLVVRLVEREPRYGAVAVGCLPKPLGEERRLAESRRSGDQGQFGLSSATQMRDQPCACHETASQLRDVQLGCDQRTRHEIPIPRGTTVSEVVPWLTVNRRSQQRRYGLILRPRKQARRLACPGRRRPPDGWAHPGFAMLTKPVVPQDANAVILKQHLVGVGVRHARIEFGVHEADATPGPRRCAGKIARLIIRQESWIRAG